MGISDEFKAKLKAGEIFDAINLALEEAIELKITTWVCSSNPDIQDPTAPAQPTADASIHTRINIVDGNIDNQVGSQFVGNGLYTELRPFHIEQMQQGRRIIYQNLGNLQQLFILTSKTTMTQLPKISRKFRERGSFLYPSNQDKLP
ncbi:MAG: hypothetical protein F6K36_02535 [Symploca sp. SIO3C6]|uniref:Uncharacterized protein n=1 Tax=Symploca sp. SIO1C4 TaxID=2607765 RepID=A0A6B3NLF9_9CYAN|nr:hypothetical protein [Symploca sp. SIO3C6]NER31272.1 hypothetical protein [Symploca sp. SIO1C4]NET05648.1 hypothetical protein [Symploca sp. SIO2B6]